MTNSGIVSIHGKDYMTVAKRVEIAHIDGLESVVTEVLQHTPVVVIKATVSTKKGQYTGISSANPLKSIEKSNPYEVAETSAVGRALGFAGYGIIEGIPSADEMNKALVEGEEESFQRVPVSDEEPPHPAETIEEGKICSAHDEPSAMRKGQSKTKKNIDGTFKTFWYHSDGEKMCFGGGWQE